VCRRPVVSASCVDLLARLCASSSLSELLHSALLGNTAFLYLSVAIRSSRQDRFASPITSSWHKKKAPAFFGQRFSIYGLILPEKIFLVKCSFRDFSAKSSYMHFRARLGTIIFVFPSSLGSPGEQKRLDSSRRLL
jgi:hypothetical protein